MTNTKDVCNINSIIVAEYNIKKKQIFEIRKMNNIFRLFIFDNIEQRNNYYFEMWTNAEIIYSNK